MLLYKAYYTKLLCNLLQALLQQDMEDVLLAESRQKHEKQQNDAHYIQVAAEFINFFPDA